MSTSPKIQPSEDASEAVSDLAQVVHDLADDVAALREDQSMDMSTIQKQLRELMSLLKSGGGDNIDGPSRWEYNSDQAYESAKKAFDKGLSFKKNFDKGLLAADSK
jgi:hypothetical protein